MHLRLRRVVKEITCTIGAYVFGTGLILYFLSKEIHVMTPEPISVTSTVGLIAYIIENYGASIGEFADKLNEQIIANLEEVKQASIKYVQNATDLEKSQQALIQSSITFLMSREITLLWPVYKEVKDHLDYHISVQNMMRWKEQEHMINWGEKHVAQSIFVQQEKETIVKCIVDLMLLAKEAQAQPVL
uniref:ATP synthase subunit b n=1 Tax=Rhinolophus ferrumequinum TaxID=59479 RepID=A0A671EJX9_RHIFE